MDTWLAFEDAKLSKFAAFLSVVKERKWLLANRYRNQHEARETYKTLKDQNIGNASVSASLYAEWAALEISAGKPTHSHACHLGFITFH